MSTSGLILTFRDGPALWTASGSILLFVSRHRQARIFQFLFFLYHMFFLRIFILHIAFCLHNKSMVCLLSCPAVLLHFSLYFIFQFNLPWMPDFGSAFFPVLRIWPPFSSVYCDLGWHRFHDSRKRRFNFNNIWLHFTPTFSPFTLRNASFFT